MAMRRLRLLCLAAALLAALPALGQGALREVTSVYHMYRGKFKLGEVTETFVIRDNRYEIESVARPILGFLLPSLTIVSRGTVTPQGLKPEHFSQSVSNRPHKTISADFDWDNGVLRLHFHGKEELHELKGPTYDTLSLRYQFLFTPPTVDGKVHLTTGKKLEEYEYRVLKEEKVSTPSGQLDALHVAKVVAEHEPRFDLWLGKEQRYLAVKVVAEDDEQRFEQVLAKVKFD